MPDSSKVEEPEDGLGPGPEDGRALVEVGPELVEDGRALVEVTLHRVSILALVEDTLLRVNIREVVEDTLHRDSIREVVELPHRVSIQEAEVEVEELLPQVCHPQAQDQEPCQ